MYMYTVNAGDEGWGVGVGGDGPYVEDLGGGAGFLRIVVAGE